MLNVFLYVIFLNQRLKLVSLKEDSGEEPIILNTVVIIGKKKKLYRKSVSMTRIWIHYLLIINQSVNKGPRTNNYLDVTCLRDILHVACLCLWPLYSTDHCPMKLTNTVRSWHFAVWNLTTTFIHIVSSLFKLRIPAIDDNLAVDKKAHLKKTVFGLGTQS